METMAVIKSTSRYLGISAAAAAVALFAYGAQAQEKKTAPAPAAKTEKTEKKAACNSLKVQTGCEARTDCNWVAESKDDKGKVKKKAYCRSNPTAKKADSKKADPKKTDAK